jgi:hypothetical protein
MTRTKGITIWEQYVEFGVLGLACVLFAFFVATQFIGNPNSITVTGHGEVGPGEVDALLEDEARRISARLQPDAAPGHEIPPPESIAPEFLARLSRPVRPESAHVLATPFIPLGTGERIPPEAVFAVPEIPSPETVVSRQYFDALDEETVEAHPELRDRFASPPYDMTWTTVAASFNAGAILREFRKGDPDGDPTPIPQSWHNDRPTIVNVIVEREEFINGVWTNRTELPPLPGQFHIRDEMDGDIDGARRDMILRLVRSPEQQRALVQPGFLSTRNDSWQPPDPLVDDLDESADEDLRVRRLQQLIARHRAERETAQRELADLPEGSRAPDQPGGDRTPPGGGGLPPGGRLPGGGAPPPGGPVGPTPPSPPGAGETDPRRVETVRTSLQQRIARLDRQIERTERELYELRPELAGIQVEADPLELDQLTIWMHDLDIAPGYQYRYRMAVELYNPFFARALHLVPEQERLAEGFAVRSEFSEWSDPISIRPPVHVFITRAYPPGHDRLGGVMGRTFGEATIEIFRFHNGRWWENSFTVEPGQRVGDRREAGPRRDEGPMIDYGTEWFVLDIIADLNATQQQFAEGRGAFVILQHLRYGEIMEMRHPLRDVESELRQRLRSEAQQVAIRE